MDLYDYIAAGLKTAKPTGVAIEQYLQSLQPSVRLLRQAYYNTPVSVAYSSQNIQAAYLVAYFPHYYQLIYSILNNDSGAIFKDKASIQLGFIGGGPGSEVYGVIKFILNNCEWIQDVTVTIFDLNADTWTFSHKIVLENIIKKTPGAEELNIYWNAQKFNLISPSDIKANQRSFESLDLLVIQNCINEIPTANHAILKQNIVALFRLLPAYSY